MQRRSRRLLPVLLPLKRISLSRTHPRMASFHTELPLPMLIKINIRIISSYSLSWAHTLVVMAHLLKRSEIFITFLPLTHKMLKFIYACVSHSVKSTFDHMRVDFASFTRRQELACDGDTFKFRVIINR